MKLADVLPRQSQDLPLCGELVDQDVGIRKENLHVRRHPVTLPNRDNGRTFLAE